MTTWQTVRALVPRRSAGLPPGQREVRTFPRFSDKPLRWPPPSGPVELSISIEGEPITHLTGDQLATMDQAEQVGDLHCVTTWTYRGLRWQGVRLSSVLAPDMVAELPPFAVAHAADKQSVIFATDDLLMPDVLLATHLDGEPLDQRHGAPLRLISPSQYGYKNVKHLTAIDFRKHEPTSTLGPKEHLRARVALEERHASLPNWALRLPYRFMIVPTALAAERGLRTSPESDAAAQ